MTTFSLLDDVAFRQLSSLASWTRATKQNDVALSEWFRSFAVRIGAAQPEIILNASDEGAGATEGECMVVPASMLRLATPLLLLLAATSASAQPAPTLASRGEAILTGDCAMCHGIGGTTGGPAYMAPSFFEIAQRADVNALREALQKGVVSGHPAMPRTLLSPYDVEAILTYLEAIGARQAAR